MRLLSPTLDTLDDASENTTEKKWYDEAGIVDQDSRRFGTPLLTTFMPYLRGDGSFR